MAKTPQGGQHKAENKQGQREILRNILQKMGL